MDFEDKGTGVTDIDNACCLQELTTGAEILNSQYVIVSDAETNNGGPSMINNDDHSVSVEEIIEDNTKNTDAEYLIFGDSLLKHLIKNGKGKMKLKWTGKIKNFKHFVSLILKCEGNWHTKSPAAK